MLDVILDALKDSAIMLPLLIAVYLLIEFLEYKEVTSFENSRLLKGRFSPLFGSLFGCVPQCGFSVISTDLYSAKKISVGALVAVYVSTSDEALPILLSSMSGDVRNGLSVLLLIGVKVVVGILAGYLAMFLYPIIFKKHAVRAPQITFGQKEVETVDTSSGCCKHDIVTDKFDFKHPLLHSLKIFAFVLAVNLIMGIIIYFVGEDNLKTFLGAGFWLQPIVAVVVGIIPNCVSSVILTNFFVDGALSFGAVVAGLCINAGLGITVLFRKNRPISENVFIVVLILVCSLVVGYGLQAVFPTL